MHFDDIQKRTLSVAETAALIGISTASVRRLLDQGRLRALPGLRHKRITRRSIDDYLSSAE